MITLIFFYWYLLILVDCFIGQILISMFCDILKRPTLLKWNTNIVWCIVIKCVDTGTCILHVLGMSNACEWSLFLYHSYEVFHKDQMDIVKNYPTMVKAELKNYDEGVCKFFEVGRNQPVSFLLLFWNDLANIFYLLVKPSHSLTCMLEYLLLEKFCCFF